MNICAGVRDIAHPRNVGRVRAVIHKNNWVDNNRKKVIILLRERHYS